MRRYIFKITKQNQVINLNEFVEFRRINVVKLFYFPKDTANFGIMQLKVNNFNSSQYINNEDTTTALISAPYIPESEIIYSNIHSREYDYVSEETQTVITLRFTILENHTPVDDAHLGIKPLLVELELS